MGDKDTSICAGVGSSREKEIGRISSEVIISRVVMNCKRISVASGEEMNFHEVFAFFTANCYFKSRY